MGPAPGSHCDSGVHVTGVPFQGQDPMGINEQKPMCPARGGRLGLWLQQQGGCIDTHFPWPSEVQTPREGSSPPTGGGRDGGRPWAAAPSGKERYRLAKDESTQSMHVKETHCSLKSLLSPLSTFTSFHSELAREAPGLRKPRPGMTKTCLLTPCPR